MQIRYLYSNFGGFIQHKRALRSVQVIVVLRVLAQSNDDCANAAHIAGM
jgi:hypothetical protein